MVDKVTAEVESDQRSVILKAAEGNIVSVSEMLNAIKVLEKQGSADAELSILDGEWLLLWTSGTKKYQQLNQASLDAPLQLTSRHNSVIQRLNTTQKWIENEVAFQFGFLCVAGLFDYTEKKRIQFTFSQLRLKLGALPTLQLPMGNWAKGWLQTTYLDQVLHIERGDRGGVSVYIRRGVSQTVDQS